ncbi:sensor histidine kinase [Streptomyces sp. NPDC057302]|uniref:sensor histidine kinase n=1 Tax=Streptomyces sp. NPDC057302 TaxID=3346094 RepID=UPI00362770D4
MHSGTKDTSDVTGSRWSPRPAPRLAHVILLAALTCYLGITAINLLSQQPSTPELVTGLATLVAVFALQLVHSRPGADRASPWSKAATLGAQALLTFLPLFFFGILWGAMAGFLGGSLLLLLSPRVAWPLYGVTGLSLLVPGSLDGMSVIDLVYMCQSTLLTGLVVYGLSRLSSLVDEVYAARAEIARMAVAGERLRLARDLHDLLGYSISAIVLKSELLQRLIRAQHPRADQEVEEVLAISRQALGDVRRVARSYRDMSLVSEVSSAQSVLDAAEVEVEVVLDPSIEEISAPAGTALATVLREGVTNLLRHSKASRCGITAVVDDGTARLTIINDGVMDDYQDSSPDSGNGLGNLEQRLTEIGGRLISERAQEMPPACGGSFHLVAEVPAQAVARNSSEQPQKTGRTNPNGAFQSADIM